MKQNLVRLVPLFMIFLPSLGYAADNNIQVGYNSGNIEYSVSGVSVDLTLEGLDYGGTIAVGDDYLIGYNFSDLDGNLLGFKFTLKITNIGVGMKLVDDLDYSRGSGSKLILGLSSRDSEISAKVNGVTYAEKEAATLLTGRYEVAAGKGLSMNLGLSGQTNNFDPTYNVGLSAVSGNSKTSLNYAWNTDKIGAVTVKATNFALSYALLF